MIGNFEFLFDLLLIIQIDGREKTFSLLDINEESDFRRPQVMSKKIIRSNDICDGMVI